MKKLSLLFCIVFSVFIISCRDFKEVQVTGVKGFKINKIDTKGINADLLLGIKNPNPMGFSIYRSEFDVVYNGINLGKARSSKRVHIGANTEETYSLNLKSDFKDINLMDIMKLVNGGGGNGMVQVKGNLKAGKFYLKKKFPVDVKERAQLK
ncbi:MAG: LEA type 2 family protein [Bacteroidetes bacterium]|nr:LEA type 2 family protein [Bacteroidota bacterium]